MLQILIWGVCLLMIGLGMCGAYLAEIAKGAEKKGHTGIAILLFMVIAAGVIFWLSLRQGEGLSNFLGK